MLKIIVGLSLVAGSAFASSALVGTSSDSYFQIGSVTVQEAKTDISALNLDLTNMSDCTQAAPLADETGVLDDVGVSLDKIINIGKKVWDIVAKGKPVVSLKTDVAHALPAGVTCWRDLTNWSMPQAKTYEVSYKNVYGFEVVHFSYRVVYTSGGSFKNTGKYLTQATIMPANVYVAWGFQLDALAEVPLVMNMGSVESPVAGMQLDMKWKVTSPLAESQMTESYAISGDGTFKSLH